jgi:hypothetical protein
MLDLMAVGQDDGPIPLYMHTVKRILRELRIAQQQTQTGFNYQEFKRRVMSSNLTVAQLEPLTQRLDTLESFMPQIQAAGSSGKRKKQPRGSDWNPKVNYRQFHLAPLLSLTYLGPSLNNCRSLLPLYFA